MKHELLWTETYAVEAMQRSEAAGNAKGLSTINRYDSYIYIPKETQVVA